MHSDFGYAAMRIETRWWHVFGGVCGIVGWEVELYGKFNCVCTAFDISAFAFHPNGSGAAGSTPFNIHGGRASIAIAIYALHFYIVQVAQQHMQKKIEGLFDGLFTYSPGKSIAISIYDIIITLSDEIVLAWWRMHHSNVKRNSFWKLSKH